MSVEHSALNVERSAPRGAVFFSYARASRAVWSFGFGVLGWEIRPPSPRLWRTGHPPAFGIPSEGRP
jgi:hypothetical protein